MLRFGYNVNTGWARKTLFLTVENFAMANVRKARDMSKDSKFHLEKSIKLAKIIAKLF